MAEYIERTEIERFIAEHGRVGPFSVDLLPSADVAPVRHAMWEAVVGSDGKEHMVCTGCRKQQDLTGVFSYCPNCGCRMDGGEQDA